MSNPVTGAIRLVLLYAALSATRVSSADDHLHTAAEAAPKGEDAGQVAAAQPVAPVRVSSGGEWVVAPIPTYDPSQSWGLQLIVQYIFGARSQTPAHDETPPSVVALGGFYTQEHSRGLFAAFQGHERDDRWRPTVALGSARINYDFYGVGTELASLNIAIPVSQDVDFAMGQLTHRIWRSLYAGARIAASRIDLSTDALSTAQISLPPVEQRVNTLSAGLVLQWDTRDNQFYPTVGTVINANAMYNGHDTDYETYSVHWNRYVALSTPSAVLALRASFQTTGGDTPFYALPQFGRHSDLRGFKSGKYRDKDLLAVQAEYRRKLAERWGVVAFAGVGEVAPSLGKLNADDLLASAGAGVRFRLARKNPVNLRFDWAYGNDGDAVYLSVGEAF